MFNCELCSFETSHKSNYKTHLKTKRHLTKIEITADNPPITRRQPADKIYTCLHCNNEYTRLDSLSRHQKYCIKQILDEKDKQFEIINNQLELLQK